jgi:hypothetical protein
MSVIAHLLSSGVARGLAALLAVLLSAVLGGRIGVDRLTPELTDEESSPVTCPLGADLVAESGTCVPATAHAGSVARPVVLAQLMPATTGDHLLAPTLLIGSAGGPRAP